MALQMSRSEIMRLAKKAESLQNRVKKATEKADQVIEKVVRTAEISATAFGFGLIQGRYGAIELAGIPIDLAAGVGGHILGFMGVGGNMNSHLHALSDGALACYAVTMGKGAGAQWKSGTKKKTAEELESEKKAQSLESGARGAGDRLTPEEMERLAG